MNALVLPELERRVSVLFVDPGGPYPSLVEDCWTETDDARKYDGPRPVVAHPPQVGLSEWTCEVWQSAYGHPARKRTWLYYVGLRRPLEMLWTRAPGTHQVGWFDRIKPTLGKKAASRTPTAFARALIELAIHSGEPCASSPASEEP